MKLKKYFPLFAFVVVLSGYLFGQILFNGSETIATQSEVSAAEKKHYESIYQSLEITTTDKKKIKLAEISAPIVVVNFWASWCKPCLQEFPSLVALGEKFKDSELKVIGINTDYEEQSKNIKKTVSEYKLNFEIVADENNKILDTFMISAIPVSIIYHKGKVIDISKGERDFTSEENLTSLRALLVKN